jgi:hypothetical protein
LSGAEIEESINSALYDAFHAGCEVTTAHILAALAQTVPLAKTMDEQISRLRHWAEGRARNASVPRWHWHGAGGECGLFFEQFLARGKKLPAGHPFEQMQHQGPGQQVSFSEGHLFIVSLAEVLGFTDAVHKRADGHIIENQRMSFGWPEGSHIDFAVALDFGRAIDEFIFADDLFGQRFGFMSILSHDDVLLRLDGLVKSQA